MLTNGVDIISVTLVSDILVLLTVGAMRVCAMSGAIWKMVGDAY